MASVNLYDALEVALEVVYKAAAKIMEFYRNGFEVEIKSDDSPVTLADKTSDKLIRETLSKKYPTHTFLTEESDDDLKRLDAEYIWIIDPLDGTKDFVEKDNEFAINVALVHHHTPILGIVAIPYTNEVYYAIKGEGSFYISSKGALPEKIHVSSKTSDLTLLTSVYHENKLEIDIADCYKDKISHRAQIGSAIKACKIAHGLAELSFRFNPNTKEWDTCAPQIVVEEAGGFFTEPDGTPITYNKKDVYNHNGFSIYNLEENNYAKEYVKVKGIKRK